MTDRIPGAPGRYSGSLPDGELQKLQRGESFAITLTRDDAPVVEGTPYSKAAVLPDELAQKLCPDVIDPAPKDAFAALHKITAQGTSGNWAYRKWENGVAEIWSVGRITLDYLFSTVLGREVTLPFPVMNPNVAMTMPGITAYDHHKFFGIALTYGEKERNDALSFFITTPESGTFNQTDYAQIHVQIVGTWK